MSTHPDDVPDVPVRKIARVRKAKSSFPPEFRAPLPQPWVPPPLEEESSVVEDPDAPRRLFPLVPLAPGQRKIAPLRKEKSVSSVVTESGYAPSLDSNSGGGFSSSAAAGGTLTSVDGTSTAVGGSDVFGSSSDVPLPATAAEPQVVEVATPKPKAGTPSPVVKKGGARRVQKPRRGQKAAEKKPEANSSESLPPVTMVDSVHPVKAAFDESPPSELDAETIALGDELWAAFTSPDHEEGDSAEPLPELNDAGTQVSDLDVTVGDLAESLSSTTLVDSVFPVATEFDESPLMALDAEATTSAGQLWDELFGPGHDQGVLGEALPAGTMANSQEFMPGTAAANSIESLPAVDVVTEAVGEGGWDDLYFEDFDVCFWEYPVTSQEVAIPSWVPISDEIAAIDAALVSIEDGTFVYADGTVGPLVGESLGSSGPALDGIVEDLVVAETGIVSPLMGGPFVCQTPTEVPGEAVSDRFLDEILGDFMVEQTGIVDSLRGGPFLGQSRTEVADEVVERDTAPIAVEDAVHLDTFAAATGCLEDVARAIPQFTVAILHGPCDHVEDVPSGDCVAEQEWEEVSPPVVLLVSSGTQTAESSVVSVGCQAELALLVVPMASSGSQTTAVTMASKGCQVDVDLESSGFQTDPVETTSYGCQTDSVPMVSYGCRTESATMESSGFQVNVPMESSRFQTVQVETTSFGCQTDPAPMDSTGFQTVPVAKTSFGCQTDSVLIASSGCQTESVHLESTGFQTVLPASSKQARSNAFDFSLVLSHVMTVSIVMYVLYKCGVVESSSALAMVFENIDHYLSACLRFLVEWTFEYVEVILSLVHHNRSVVVAGAAVLGFFATSLASLVRRLREEAAFNRTMSSKLLKKQRWILLGLVCVLALVCVASLGGTGVIVPEMTGIAEHNQAVALIALPLVGDCGAAVPCSASLLSGEEVPLLETGAIGDLFSCPLYGGAPMAEMSYGFGETEVAAQAQLDDVEEVSAKAETEPTDSSVRRVLAGSLVVIAGCAKLVPRMRWRVPLGPRRR